MAPFAQPKVDTAVRGAITGDGAFSPPVFMCPRRWEKPPPPSGAWAAPVVPMVFQILINLKYAKSCEGRPRSELPVSKRCILDSRAIL
jgi:hypothetical protein